MKAVRICNGRHFSSFKLTGFSNIKLKDFSNIKLIGLSNIKLKELSNTKMDGSSNLCIHFVNWHNSKGFGCPSSGAEKAEVGLTDGLRYMCSFCPRSVWIKLIQITCPVLSAIENISSQSWLVFLFVCFCGLHYRVSFRSVWALLLENASPGIKMTSGPILFFIKPVYRVQVYLKTS